MSDTQTIEFATTKAKYDAARAANRHVVYTAALHLPQELAPLCSELRALAASANSVNVLRPFSSFRLLKELRATYALKQPTIQAAHASCIQKLAEPVEGVSAIDLAWIQGITSAAGISALSNLTSAASSASEALDRKSAYAMACFSLYVSVTSLVATVVLGVMSLSDATL
jgi:hypothetical protein